MDYRVAVDVRVDGEAAAPSTERVRPTLPVRRYESAIFRGWGPRL